jgi:uncharacterized protein YcfJ
MTLCRSVLIHRVAGKLSVKVVILVQELSEKEIKMISNLQKIFATLLVVIAYPSWAGHNNDPYPEPAYDNNQYEYAKVIDVQPVTETVQIPQDRQVCREQSVQRRVAEYRSPGPAIFGAILGGVIGNQFSRGHGHGHGHGNNRAVATVAGAAIGSLVARDIQYSKYPPKYYTGNVQICSTETSWRSEEQVIAWDVSWEYRGRIYHSRMDEPPGDRIRVRISVVPVNP